MNKIIKVFPLLTMLLLLLFTTCQKSKDNNLGKNKNLLKVIVNTSERFFVEIEIDQKKIDYNSEIKNGKTESILKVITDNSIIFESKYELDTTIADYRLLQHKKVEVLAKSLKFDLQEKDYSNLSLYVKTLLETVFQNSVVRKRHIQSLFFHYAIINTKMRAMQRGDNLFECVPYPGYIIGKSYFWSMEDFLVKTTLIKGVYKSHPELLQDKPARDLYNFVNSTDKNYISYDKIYYFNTTKENYLKTLDNILIRNNLSNSNLKTSVLETPKCLLGQGSDWGCCGNYSGCCVFWNVACYIHDAMCSDCQPRWFCFSGCVPD